MWKIYDVKMTGINELLGGMPKTQELIEGMMSAKETRIKAAIMGRDPEKIIADNLKAMGVNAEEEIEEILKEEKLSCGFRKDPSGSVCVGGHQIPSMLIDCASSLKFTTKYRGFKDVLTRNTDCFQSGNDPCLLKITRSDAPLTEPDGTLEWGSQVRDRMGSRAILRRYDYVMPWEIACTIRLLDNGSVPNKEWDEVWAQLWEVAQVQRFGAARPRGYGRFTTTWTEVK
jgi:hypothetical protein